MTDQTAEAVMAPAEQLVMLRALGAATVYEAQGQIGALDPAIKPIDRAMRFAAPAFTVTVRPGDNLAVHYALTRVRPGEALMIDADGYVGAGLWGDVLTEAAMAAGVAAVVINGAIRDSEAISKMGLPVFARGIAIGGTFKNQPGKIGATIVCGNATIAPGDILVGDADGLAVITAAEVSVVLAAARRREAEESVFRQKLRLGATSVALLGLEEKLARSGMT